MFGFKGIAHLHLKVSNIERSVDFYCRTFGMEIIGQKYEGKMVILVMKEHFDVFTLSEGSVGVEIHQDSVADVGQHGGFDHFGFALSTGSSLNEAVDHLKKMGAEFVKYVEIAPGINTAFFRDPDGYAFQIWVLP